MEGSVLYMEKEIRREGFILMLRQKCIYETI